MSVRSSLELLLLALLWGVSFLMMRVAVPEFGPVALLRPLALFPPPPQLAQSPPP